MSGAGGVPVNVRGQNGAAHDKNSLAMPWGGLYHLELH